MTPSGESDTLPRDVPSESGYGWCDDGWTPFWPRTPCLECGRFVGRNGHFSVEHFEMSSEIASVEATCGRCLHVA
jgi:hypothetical protein